MSLDNIPQGKINLDEILNQFKSWQQYVNDVTKRNAFLIEEVTNLKKMLNSSQEHQIELQNNVKEQKSLVETLQAALVKRCDFEEESVQIKEEVRLLKEKNETMKKESQIELLRMQKNLNEEIEKCDKKIKDMELQCKSKVRTEKECLKNEIAEKSNEIASLKKHIHEIELNHQTKVNQLRVECDSKLLKLQKQNSKVNQSPSGVVNQEIFRKKLQHARAEADKEIASLKMIVNDLRQKVTVLEQRNSKPSGLSMQNKKRRF